MIELLDSGRLVLASIRHKWSVRPLVWPGLGMVMPIEEPR